MLYRSYCNSNFCLWKQNIFVYKPFVQFCDCIKMRLVVTVTSVWRLMSKRTVHVVVIVIGGGGGGCWDGGGGVCVSVCTCVSVCACACVYESVSVYGVHVCTLCVHSKFQTNGKTNHDTPSHTHSLCYTVQSGSPDAFQEAVNDCTVRPNHHVVIITHCRWLTSSSAASLSSQL